MELKDILKQIHRTIEVKNSRDYKYQDMADYIGVNPRTYGEYLRGGIAPLAMKTLLDMLSNLDDADIVHIVRLWEETQKEGEK
ncbi:hypothetical protein [Sulfurovum sp. AR]|uniref:hypothetical protein n=1 Tax=Sulfurovum sp. AR TaxID=1165841 RepID=UPI00025C4D42|nr:hypothetical protein [Sulfurovum sp. AR]EIF51382.1 hypothetical protein SULAR_04022 [Sulfurovum sp. AR]